MEKSIHGGDIYRNKIAVDFSVNINPLGIPEKVQRSLYNAVSDCIRYPDIEAEKLKISIGKKLGVQPEEVVCGNGASELFTAIANGLKPQKAILPVPSFLGYEKALKAVDCNIEYYFMSKEDGYILNKKIKEVLTDEVDILFIANPNNPIGNVINKEILIDVINWCKERSIIVVLDECFVAFTGDEKYNSMIRDIKEYPNLIIVQAFTKIYAIPGVRLGYLICGSEKIKEKIQRQLPEWNISVFAQEAGVTALKEIDYVKKTVELVNEERMYLTEKLSKLDIKTYPSDTNFMLLETKIDLYNKLLDEKILVRDCSNFKGLGENFYRIAIKLRKENEILVKAIEKIKEG